MGLLDKIDTLYAKKTRQGWLAREIAEKAGLSTRGLVNIIHGHTANPGVRTVERLYDTLRNLGTRT